jgi:hypothetical protein
MKQLIPTSCKNTTEFSQRVSSICNMTPVQTIGVETIVAGQVIMSSGNANNSQLVLMHGKLPPNMPKYMITVRSNDQNLTNAVWKAVNNVIA